MNDIFHSITSWSSSLIILIMGGLFLAIGIPKIPHLKQLRYGCLTLALSYFILGTAGLAESIAELFGKFVPCKSLTVLTVSFFQALLFNHTSLAFLRLGKINVNQMLLQAGSFTIILLALYATFFFWQDQYPYMFGFTIAVYIAMLVYFATQFNKEFNQEFNNPDVTDYRLFSDRMRRVYRLFYVSLSIGVMALAYVLINDKKPFTDAFTISYTGYYIYVVYSFISFLPYAKIIGVKQTDGAGSLAGTEAAKHGLCTPTDNRDAEGQRTERPYEDGLSIVNEKTGDNKYSKELNGSDSGDFVTSSQNTTIAREKRIVETANTASHAEITAATTAGTASAERAKFAAAAAEGTASGEGSAHAAAAAEGTASAEGAAHTATAAEGTASAEGSAHAATAVEGTASAEGAAHTAAAVEGTASAEGAAHTATAAEGTASAEGAKFAATAAEGTASAEGAAHAATAAEGTASAEGAAHAAAAPGTAISGQTVPPIKETRSERRLTEALDRWVKEERYLRPDAPIEEIANELETDVYSLHDYFLSHKGILFRTWRVMLRIEKAKQLLETDPEIKIAVLQQEVGFSDKSYFFRRFKQMTGKTPNEYRNDLKKHE